MRLRQSEAVSVMNTLLLRWQATEDLGLLTHPEMRSMDQGGSLFRAWQDAKVIADAKVNQVRLAVALKRKAAKSARTLLREARLLLRQLVAGDPWRLDMLGIAPGPQSRADQAVLGRLQLLLSRLPLNPQWHERTLEDGAVLRLDPQLESQLRQAHSDLEVAIFQTRDAMIHHRRAKAVARDLEKGFRNWFEPATLQLRTIIRSRFAGEKDHLFAYYAMDLHENRLRQREAAYRQRRRASMTAGTGTVPDPPTAAPTPEPAQTQAVRQGCLHCGCTCAATPKVQPPAAAPVIPFPQPTAQPMVFLQPQPAVAQPVAPVASEPEPAPPELPPGPNRPATPDQLIAALTATQLWAKRLFDKPTTRIDRIENILKILWQRPSSHMNDFKHILTSMPEPFLTRTAAIVNIPFDPQEILEIDRDRRRATLNRRLLLEVYGLPEIFMG